MDYPFLKCEHPKEVRNLYTGDVFMTSCGVCPACSLNRANKMTLLCQFEEMDYLYCSFITLTYSNDYIPKCYPVYSRDSKGYVFHNRSSRLQDEGEVLHFEPDSFHNSNPNYMQLFLSKFNLQGFFPYLSKRDVQLFMKRLRKNISKFSYEKIRYYCVGEYGPKTYRPHYHFLLFYNDTAVKKNMDRIVRECWKYGRVHIGESFGTASSYVAGYVNSNVALPQIFSNRAFRPFSLHSNRFAMGFYKSKRKEIYQSSIEDFMCQTRRVGQYNVEFAPWRSFESRYFPKCTEYSRKSRLELLHAYTSYASAIRRYGKKPTNYLVQDIFNDKHYKLSKYYLSLDMPHDMLCNRIYRDLSISKYFIEFVCDNSYDRLVWIRNVDMIIKHYSDKEYYSLKRMYQQQIDLYNEYHDPHLYCYFYSNLFYVKPDNEQPINEVFVRGYSSAAYAFLDSLPNGFLYQSHLLKKGLQGQHIFKKFQTYVDNMVSKKTKHKEQNDLNNFFLDL